MLPLLEDTVLFLIIQNPQTLYYHIKDTRCQHVVTRRKPRWEASVKSSSGPGQVLRQAQSPFAACLSIGPTCSQRRSRPGGCPHGRPVPESGPWGLSVDRPVASASNSESPSFCHGPCSAEGRAMSGPGQRPSASPCLWAPPCRLRWQAREVPPFELTPLPHALGEENTHCCAAGIVKLNFPDVQAPGARACCLERKWGLGKAEPYFLHAHPAFPVPPSTAGAVNHSVQRPTAWPSLPAPKSPASLLPSDPRPHLSGQPWGQAGARGRMAGDQ